MRYNKSKDFSIIELVIAAAEQSFTAKACGLET
jgi:hypothetical protein